MMKYFTFFELEFSQSAFDARIKNQPTAENEQNLAALVAAVLDPLREAYGKPITVTSGFRNTKVNTYIHGANDSQHKKGEAADICIPKKPAENYKLAQLIAKLGNYDQLILEDVKSTADYSQPQWVHVSWKRSGLNRHQILIKLKGQNKYIVLNPSDLK